MQVTQPINAHADPRPGPRFTLYSRSYCHLCDDMLQALRVFDVSGTFRIDVVDVDADPALVALYDELVPVLIGHQGESIMQICHYFLDLTALQAFLGNSGEPAVARTDC